MRPRTRSPTRPNERTNVAKLDEIIAEAAAEADKQFAGAAHVTAEQIEATAAAAGRKVSAQASQLVTDGLTEAILAKMKAKPRVPKAEPAKP